MKILFINNGVVGEHPGVSGGETRYIEIAKNWAAKGHEIHLLSSLGGKYLCDRFGLPVQLHPMIAVNSQKRWAHVFRLYQAIFQLPKSIFEERFDLVYSTSELSYDVLPAFLIKRRHGDVRWAVAVHWLPPFPPWKRSDSSVWNSTAFFVTERLGLYLARRFANILLPISVETGHQLAAVRVPKERYTSVECGVVYDKIQAIAHTVKTKAVHAIFMKRLQAVKGVFDLLDIWQQVVRVKPDAQLTVVGDGFDGERMKQMTRDRQLDKNIEYCGVIYDFEEKFKKLAEAKLFLLPSHEENWAIVIGEALAAGTPVIAYDLKELRSVWQQNCLFVKEGNTTEFANQVLHLFDDEEEWTKRRKAGLEYVQRYDWKRIAEREWDLVFA